MTQCSICGESVPETADVCPSCGTEMSAQAPAPPQAVPVPPQAVPVPPQPPSPPAPAPTPPPPGAARIILKRNGVPAETFAVGEQAVIGRFDAETGPVDVDLGQLPEAVYVSRNHAEILKNGGSWAIKDLGASNGTFHRARGQGKFQRVTGEQALNDGDEFALGNARFEFRVG